jgi:hypothetical protein
MACRLPSRPLLRRIALVASLLAVAPGCSRQRNLIPQESLNAPTVSVLLRWKVPNQSDIAGYRVYRGAAPHKYGPALDAGSLMSASFNGTAYYLYPNVPLGRSYFAVTTYSVAGVESDYSNEKVIDITSPSAPRADTGPDQTCSAGDVITLGAAPDPGARYFWEQTAGPPARLSDRTNSRTQVSTTTAGTYQFALIAYNAQGVAATAVVNVVVNGPGVGDGPDALGPGARGEPAQILSGVLFILTRFGADVASLVGVPTGTQPMDPMIFRYSASSNALRVVVRMLPPLAIEMASLANASSFGASMMTTMS